MKLNYRKLGSSGPPLIIVHGLYGASDNWISIGKELAEDFEVYMIDQRNHGSSPHDPIHNYTAMRDDLMEFMDSHSLGQSILIGHSMGGKTVMSFALQYPERVLSLIVVDIAPVSYLDRSSTSKLSANHAKMIDAMLELPIEKMDAREDAFHALSEKIGSERIRMFLLKNLTRNKKGEFSWKINLLVLKESLETIMDNIEMDAVINEGGIKGFPALFIHGENSDYLLPDDHDTILKLFPGAEFSSIPNAGHWVHAEQPALFLKTVKYFLG